MSAPETLSRAGEDLSPGLETFAFDGPDLETKTAVAGFLSELRGLTADVTTRLQQQDERMTLLDRKMTHAAHRPMLSAGADAGAPHRQAFDAYVRSGDDAGFRGLASTVGLEGKAMSTIVAAD
ncbi:MAG TPA: hypothetical protein VM899_03505, partial [Rubellimicrobium sp.]|nr:hypothetical protein [Rubellimicrobium sp.]